MANYKIKGNTILADIDKLTEEELTTLKKYRALGYEIENKVFKKGVSKDEMLKELEADEEVKKDFETAYSIKASAIKNNDKAVIDTIKGFEEKYGINIIVQKGENKGKYIVGYHLACQIYTKWKKAQEKKDK